MQKCFLILMVSSDWYLLALLRNNVTEGTVRHNSDLQLTIHWSPTPYTQTVSGLMTWVTGSSGFSTTDLANKVVATTICMQWVHYKVQYWRTNKFGTGCYIGRRIWPVFGSQTCLTGWPCSEQPHLPTEADTWNLRLNCKALGRQFCALNTRQSDMWHYIGGVLAVQLHKGSNALQWSNTISQLTCL